MAYGIADKYTLTVFFNKKFIFFIIKEARVLLFILEYYIIKTDIIRYHLSPNY